MNIPLLGEISHGQTSRMRMRAPGRLGHTVRSVDTGVPWWLASWLRANRAPASVGIDCRGDHSCGILACPSHREPLGRVIFEAWDAGAIPVVFAGAGGAAETVAASGGGLLYDEQTPQALADALAKAVALEEEEVAQLIGNGRAWLETNCAPDLCGRAVADVLATAAH